MSFFEDWDKAIKSMKLKKVFNPTLHFNYDKKLHEALLTITKYDIELLSYKGQTVFNEFAKYRDKH